MAIKTKFSKHKTVWLSGKTNSVSVIVCGYGRNAPLPYNAPVTMHQPPSHKLML